MKATEAYQLIHDQLDEFPQVWGAESRDVYAILDTLGSAARIVGRGDEAAKWLGQAWQGRKHVLGEDNEETLASLNNLALALLTDGKPVDAESLFRQAAAAAWPQGEGGMRSRATAQFNLGLTLKVQEKWSEAAEPMREALKVYRRQSGLADAETSMVVATLLDVLAANDLAADWEEAESLLVELLPPIQKTFATGSPQVIDVLNRLGQARLRLRKYEAAETPIREVLAIREKTQANVWTTFNTKSLLGSALLGQKKFADAEPFLLAGYEGMKQREKTIPAQGEVRLAEALDRLIQYYTETNKPDEMKKWQAERAKNPQPTPPQESK